MRVTPADQAEFDTMLAVVDSLTVRMKRQIFSAMRNGATRHTFIPCMGMTYGQVAAFLALRDKAS
jgi:hypothetical protein